VLSHTPQHPNVIRLIRVLNEPDFIIIVLDFAPGGDLKAYVRAQPEGRLQEDVAREKFLQACASAPMCACIYCVHDLELVHLSCRLLKELPPRTRARSSIEI
jgi:serine/threonine protein kinase